MSLYYRTLLALGGAFGTLKRVWLSDSHDARNALLGGTANPLQTAYLSLPLADRNEVDYVCFGGDAWSSEATPNETQIKNELSAAGITDKVFALSGNHDEQGYKHLSFDEIFDPFGTSPSTSGRTSANFPIQPVGNARCYSLKRGNFYNLLIGDNQNFGNRQGEVSGLGTKEFNAAGGYSNSDWRLAVYKFLSNLDCNIIWSNHHPFKSTTFGSNFLDSILAGFAWLDPTDTLMYVDFETMRGSYMAFIENSLSEKVFSDFWKSVHGHAICVETGHIHAGIDEVIDGLTWYELVDGTYHIYKAAVTTKNFNTSFRSFVTPMVTFETIAANNYKVQCYVWQSYGGRSVGYQSDLELNIPLRYPYNENYVSSNPSAPLSPVIIGIDVSVKGCATINSSTSAHGFLIVRKLGGYATFTPTADTAYLRGDTAGDGVVVMMGTNTFFQDYGLFGGTHYYSVWSFSGKNDKISYSASPSQSTAVVVTADITKILADMALDGGECIQFLDSRLGVTNNSGVEVWDDQSANGMDAGQTTSADRPVYDSTAQRISYSGTTKFLSTAYNADHYFGHPTASWLFDIPFGIFAKVRIGDATQFRIDTKSDTTNIEFIFAVNSSDKLFFGIFDSSLSNGTIGIETTLAITAYENTDLFLFVNYLGGRDFQYGGVELFVYDKDGILITSHSIASIATSGTYRKIRNNSLTLQTGKQTFGSTFSKGQINGKVIKRGKQIEAHERNYLMDYFRFADDTSSVTYQAVTDRRIAIAATGPGATFLAAQAQLYTDLASVWSKIKYFLVLANDGSKEFALINWRNPAVFGATDVNTTTFVSGSGIDFDGSADYLNTNARLVTDLGMGLNNSHLGVYCYEDIGAAGVTVGSGVSTSNSALFINPRNGSNNFVTCCNDGTAHSIANASSIGYYCVSRSASGSYAKYKNGSSVATVSVTSTNITNIAPFIGAMNTNGSPGSYLARGVSMVHLGTALDAADVALINTAWNTFRTAVGL